MQLRQPTLVQCDPLVFAVQYLIRALQVTKFMKMEVSYIPGGRHGWLFSLGLLRLIVLYVNGQQGNILGHKICSTWDRSMHKPPSRFL